MPFDATGYTAETLPEVLETMAATAVAEYGPETDTSENSVLGILLGLVAIQVVQQSQHIQEFYNNLDPDNAEGKSLDDIAYRMGLIRKAGTHSTVSVEFTNNSAVGQTVPIGTRLTSTSGARFLTDSALVIGVGATETVTATAEQEGALEAAANSITDYAPAIADVTVNNLTQAAVGTQTESDTELRLRIAEFRSAGGNATENAIATQISNLNGVTRVRVVENATSSPVSRGTGNTERPPHSFESVVEGGDDTEISQIILATKPAGVEPFGDTAFSATDVQGVLRNVAFTRPTILDLHVRITYTVYCEEVFPVTGEMQIIDSLLSFAEQEYTLGKDIIPQRLIRAVYGVVPGIQNVIIETSIDGVDFSEFIRPLQVFERATLAKANITLIKA